MCNYSNQSGENLFPSIRLSFSFLLQLKFNLINNGEDGQGAFSSGTKCAFEYTKLQSSLEFGSPPR